MKYIINNEFVKLSRLERYSLFQKRKFVQFVAHVPFGYSVSFVIKTVGWLDEIQHREFGFKWYHKS